MTPAHHHHHQQQQYQQQQPHQQHQLQHPLQLQHQQYPPAPAQPGAAAAAYQQHQHQHQHQHPQHQPPLSRTPPSPRPNPAKRPRPSSPPPQLPPAQQRQSLQQSADHPSVGVGRQESPPPSASATGGAPSPASDTFHGASSASHDPASAPSTGGGKLQVGQSSNFRNVSACNRCRLRKNRCDQRLPSCASCEKAAVACVGYDPITKKEIPRSYVFYLETRIEQLEALLQAHDISFPDAEDLEPCSRVTNGSSAAAAAALSPGDFAARASQSEAYETASSAGGSTHQGAGEGPSKLQRLVSQTAVPGSSNPRYLGATSGVSFARVVFAAVQSSMSDQKSISDKAGVRPSSRPNHAINIPLSAGATSMRDSFFGLHTRPTIHPAAFPNKQLATRLITLYFQHANPQIPVLHRVDFMRMFEQAYADDAQRGPKVLYILNMVFAIGSAQILSESRKSSTRSEPGDAAAEGKKQCQPEEYHASAIVHLEACLSSGGSSLEELQAVLLLANFALLRPVPPGLWYIVGVAMRLAIDLGLHYEEGKDPETGLDKSFAHTNDLADRERGRREYIRDLRRRLWWCTYSLDRLVSMCVGRPFGISDQAITTEFPSLLEDKFITPQGITEPPPDQREPSSKLVAEHYFRLRLLQSEILQVLQYQQAQAARGGGKNRENPYMHTKLPSPFLARFDSFRSWRIDIDRRLYEWKQTAPNPERTGVGFSTDFLELNYFQAVILLYRQSLRVPAMFESEYHISKEMNSPSIHNIELREDEDRVYLKVAEAGQKILRLYRNLHLKGVVNYTYLATNYLFMAGISYLYAIWHSPIVRSRLSMDEVDFTILAANSVFTDLSDKCPPAETCRDTFDRTARATIQMATSTGGFGPGAQGRAHASARGGHQSSSRNGSDAGSRGTADWGGQGDASSSRSHHTGPRSRRLGDRVTSPHQHPEGPFQTAPSPPIQPHHGQQFRPTAIQDNKMEQEPFTSMMRPVSSRPPRSIASSSDIARTPDSTGAGDPNSVAAAAAAAMVSPTFGQQQMQRHSASPSVSSAALMNSPNSAITPRTAFPGNNMDAYMNNAQQYAPGMVSFADMQGIDFINSLTGGGGGNNQGAPMGGGYMDPQMDLGLGFGWEGQHHDFSEGGQIDLFNGFFFGGPQGGAGDGSGGM